MFYCKHLTRENLKVLLKRMTTDEHWNETAVLIHYFQHSLACNKEDNKIKESYDLYQSTLGCYSTILHH